MDQVKDIQERVERRQYEVDPTKVASAIVRRLLEGRTLGDPGASSSN